MCIDDQHMHPSLLCENDNIVRHISQRFAATRGDESPRYYAKPAEAGYPNAEICPATRVGMNPRATMPSLLKQATQTQKSAQPHARG